VSASLSSDSPFILGIDVGTSSIKVAVFAVGDSAQPLAVARRRSTTSSPRFGWSEADPHRMLRLVFDCIRELTAELDAAKVAAIGISGTACGAWLLSREHDLVRPPILWNDGRASDIVDEWARTGFVERIFARSGNVPFTGYTLPTLVWLDRHEPQSVRGASTVLFCKDWIRLALTGQVGTDVTDASYVPFDIRNRRWDAALFEEAGIGHLVRLLPEIRHDDETAPLLAARARELGLPGGIPVAIGATDIIAGLVGSGSVTPGKAVTILGTSANSSLVTDEPDFTPPNIGIMAASALGCFARTMISTSGTTTLDWAASLLSEGDVPRLLALADRADPTADRPILVPYLARTGTVAPIADAHARGTMAGLRLDHTPADLARSAVEGLAFAVADTYACMTGAPTEITAVGGGARSPLLLQTIADATGAIVVKPVGDEFGTRGAALMAAHSAGFVSDAELVAEAGAVARERTYLPREEPLPGQFHRYRSARDATSAIWTTW
jgi:erythritol kinase (D-erythritol 1-phosphate-forming)